MTCFIEHLRRLKLRYPGGLYQHNANIKFHYNKPVPLKEENMARARTTQLVTLPGYFLSSRQLIISVQTGPRGFEIRLQERMANEISSFRNKVSEI